MIEAMDRLAVADSPSIMVLEPSTGLPLIPVLFDNLIAIAQKLISASHTNNYD